MDIIDVVTNVMDMQTAQINQKAAVSVLKMSLDMQQETAISLLRIMQDSAAITGKGSFVNITA